MDITSLSIIDVICDLVAANNSRHTLMFDLGEILPQLLQEELNLQGLMPWSSNYTFLVKLGNQAEDDADDEEDEEDQNSLQAIYKPCQGERPLWDFPDRTLCQREFASYLVSQALGWPRIPPTVLRATGPHGRGSLQLFIEAEYEAHYFNMRDISAFIEDFREVALFDHITNNADRKGGHCLKDEESNIWAIDHGLTFHTQYKLRTVIWEYSDEVIPDPLLQDLDRLYRLLCSPSDFHQVLSELLLATELEAFQKRVERLLEDRHFPQMRGGRNVPYPPI